MARQCARPGTARLLLNYWGPSQAICSSSTAAAGELGVSALLGPSSSASSAGLCLLRQAAARLAASQGLSTAAAAQQALPRQRSPFRRLSAMLRDYKKLSKFRLSGLVALTASAGFAAGSGDSLDVAKLAWTSLGTLGAAACANTLNQVYEVFNDSRMARTAARPLPAGRISSRHAKAFALVTGAAGLWILADKTNPLTTALGAANIVLYAGVYTPLKQISIANTWVGAVVGAIPPLMGWAAAAGELEPGAWVLAAALFSWQMPHFLALAWMCRDDYRRGGFRMLPSVDPTGRRTAAVALRHIAFLLPLGAVAAALQVTSPWFAGEAAVLAAAMGAGALAFRANPTAAGARKLFRGSLLYLPLLLAGLAVHRLPNTHAVSWQDVREHAAARVSSISQHLPEQLQPGELWGQLQQLHWPQLRPFEERYAMLLQVQQQLQSIKCPSRAYGECLDDEGMAVAAAALEQAAAESGQAVGRSSSSTGSSSSNSSSGTDNS